MLSNSPSIWYCFPRAATFGIITANLGAPGKHSTCNHITNHMKCRTRISHAITGNLFPQKVHFNDVTPATFLISFPWREPSPVHLPAIDMVKNGGQGIRAARLRAKKLSLSFWSEEEQIGRKEDTDQGDGRRLRMIVEQGAEDRGNQSEHQSVGLNLDLRKLWKCREGAGGRAFSFRASYLVGQPISTVEETCLTCNGSLTTWKPSSSSISSSTRWMVKSVGIRGRLSSTSLQGVEVKRLIVSQLLHRHWQSTPTSTVTLTFWH